MANNEPRTKATGTQHCFRASAAQQMGVQMRDDSAWSRMVVLLDRSSVRDLVVKAEQRATERVGKTDWRNRPHLVVRLLGRASSQVIAVSWRDPLSCHYGHQAWRASVAAQSGNCVISGRSIRCGDAIYRPEKSDPPPVNLGAMISAFYVDTVLRCAGAAHGAAEAGSVEGTFLP